MNEGRKEIIQIVFAPIRHADLGTDEGKRRNTLRALIASGKIRLGGNALLKIYGTLSCASGKRMKMGNRVFFKSEEEAINAGYRPCSHCLHKKYVQWKSILPQRRQDAKER